MGSFYIGSQKVCPAVVTSSGGGTSTLYGWGTNGKPHQYLYTNTETPSEGDVAVISPDTYFPLDSYSIISVGDGYLEIPDYGTFYRNSTYDITF